MIQDFINLLFPRICACCDAILHTYEASFCTSCGADLPVTNDFMQDENELTKVFYGRIPIQRASALLYYEKGGLVQNLLHDLKYRGNQEVSKTLGEWHAALLKETSWGDAIEAVMPVPINQQRLVKRGYNQVDLYAKSFAKVLGIECIHHVLKRKNTGKASQVFKNRIARAKVVQSDFYIEDSSWHDLPKKILLVDDIVTTGATLEACCNALLKLPNLQISLAAMALAK